MADPFDIYCDQFQVTTGAYGCVLNLSLSNSTPPAPGSAVPTELLGSVRMSLEHLKVMTFLLRRQVKQHEENTSTSISLPIEVLNSLQISPEDWETFWR